MKILNRLTILMSLVAVLGCSDFLDELPESQISADEFYSDAASAEIGLTGVYNRFFNENAYPLMVVMTQVSTDDVKQASGAYFQYKDRTQMLASNANANAWENMYEAIVNANYLIEQVALLPEGAFSPNEARKAHILAEARFVRAIAYYYLAVGWGDVPLITDFPENIQEVYVAKSPRQQVMEFVRTELEQVASTLPDELTVYSNDATTNARKGRASKWAAKAYLARLALSENNWSRALELSNEVLNGPFSLASTWRNIFQHPMNSSESIFEMQNDLSPGFFGSGIHGWFFGYDFEWSPEAIALYARPEEIGKTQGQDVRFDLAYTPHAWVGNQFSANKYIPKRGFAAGGIESANMLLIRLSEVLFNKAEALNELSFEANKEEVVALLNLIRIRAADPTWQNEYFAGVPVGTTGIPLLDPADFETQEELRQMIREEKRREFLFEDVIRWVDLLRWDKEYAMQITNSPTEDHLYWPIPPSEILRNEKLVQNPAYTR